MTPIKSFRPRWVDRCLYRRRPFFLKLAWCLAIMLAAILLWFSVKQHLIYASAAQEIALAKQDTADALDILNGKKVMAEYHGRYMVTERITWQLEEKKINRKP